MRVVSLLLYVAAGVVGGVIFTIQGLSRGEAGQLDRILALAFFAMAAAGLVGGYALRGERQSPEPAAA